MNDKMTVIKLRDKLNAILKSSKTKDNLICVPTAEGRIGPSAFVEIENVQKGFDWNNGLVFLIPEKQILPAKSFTLQNISCWTEEIGDCLWWKDKESAMNKSAQYIGNPLCSDWPAFLKTNDAVFIPHPNVIMK